MTVGTDEVRDFMSNVALALSLTLGVFPAAAGFIMVALPFVVMLAR